jgi:hypothetical protein
MLRSDRDGFALPMSILLIGFLTAGVMAAFSRTDSEGQTVRNAVNQVDAYTLAEAGLNRAIANRSTGPATATYDFPGGSAIVDIHMVRPMVSIDVPAIYLIRSEGRPISGAMESQGRHIVSTFAVWEPGSMNVRSAWSTLSGMHYNGDAGVIDGNDNCGVMPPLPGVVVPSGSYTYTSHLKQPAGDPPVDESHSQEQLNEYIGVDWNAIVNDGAITPSVIIPPDAWPNFTDPDHWPVIYVKNGADGNFTIPGDGRGTLIVEGNLMIDGDTQWRGVIMAGGNLVANGNNNVLGATITSLNVQLGLEVDAIEVLNGQKTYAYDSCNVAMAMQHFATMRPLGNAWSDVWQESLGPVVP